MGRSHFICVVLGALLLSLTSACARTAARTRPVETHELSVTPKDYRFIKTVKGRSCTGRYLTFFRFFPPNPIEAASAAMKEAPEANFHVSVQEEFLVPLIYHRVCVSVEGVAVKIRKSK